MGCLLTQCRGWEQRTQLPRSVERTGSGDPGDVEGSVKVSQLCGFWGSQLDGALLQSPVLPLEPHLVLHLVLRLMLTLSISSGQGSPVPTLSPAGVEMADPQHPASQGLNALCSQRIDRSVCEKSGHGCMVLQPCPFPIYLI